MNEGNGVNSIVLIFAKTIIDVNSWYTIFKPKTLIVVD